MSGVTNTTAVQQAAGQGATGASRRDEAQLATAARQFEAIFLEKMLGAMRSSVPESGLTPKQAGSDMFQFMSDRAVAEHMTTGRGVGIADFLYRQWTGDKLSAQPSVVAAPGMPIGHTLHTSGAGSAGHAATQIPTFDHVSAEGEGLDNGAAPLRDLLPPTGLEEDDFFLNAPGRGPDRPSGNASHASEVNHEHESITTDHDHGATRPSGGDHSRGVGSISNGNYRRAIESYQRTDASGGGGGHESHGGAGGGGTP